MDDGRGGKVFVVTSLEDKGPGTLREAIEAKGPRTVVFGVAGIITLETPLAINHPFITIAGQSAPGDGVCVKGHSTYLNTHDVVIRYMRFRRGNLKNRDDALGGNPSGNVIVDHVSASWGLDENLSLYRHMQKQADGSPDKKLPVENLTIQWSISSEALDLNNHAFGGTWGGKNASFHHNLFACNTGRNPSIGMGGTFDFRNNVLFNWRHRTMDGGDGSSRVNVVNNYYKPGPITAGQLRYRICKVEARNAKDRFPGAGKWFVEGNVVDGFPKISANNWSGGVQFAPEAKLKDETIPSPTEKQVRSKEAFTSAPVTTHSAEEAFELVLANSGSTLPKRDAVDVRVIESVRTGKTSTKTGILETPADVGGWPEYKAARFPTDTDKDGMPDEWEKKHALDPKDATDSSKDSDSDGYRNLEEFLNGTDPTKFVDYTKPENNVNLFHTKVANRK
ncbi:MAG: polysaccharide lyase [Planctomycetia bacterium]|nr:polysaccharide lyase [Planctomycetia bacterium]